MAEIRISNKMSTMYDLLGRDESTFDVEVIVGVYVDDSINTDVTVRASRSSDIPVQLDVVYSGTDEIEVDVQPIIQSSIPVEIEINPVNRMAVRFEISEPKTIQYELSAIKDTFVSPNTPFNVVNFGSNNSMKVGTDSYGNSIAYVGFDINEVPFGKLIKSAKLRIYYTSYNGYDLQLNKVNDLWSEYGLTYENIGMLSPLNTSYEVNYDQRYIDFDILDIFNQWYTGTPNNGVAITSEDFITLLRARESGEVPTLLVEYYSDEIYSIRNSTVFTEVEVAILKDSEIPILVDVISLLSYDEIQVELLAHQKDEIINSDIEVILDVPSYKESSEIQTELTVILNGESPINVEVEVPVIDADSEIETEVLVVMNAESSINVEVEIPLYEDVSTIDVEVTADASGIGLSTINVEVTAPLEVSSSINVEFEIPDKIPKDGYNEIYITTEVIEEGTLSEIPIEISVYGYENSEVPVEIGVLGYGNSEIYTEIGVLAYGDESIDVEVYARVLDVSNINVDVQVVLMNKKSIYCYLI